MFVYFSSPQLTAATDRINSLREEQEQLRKENETILQCNQKKEEVRSLTLNLNHTAAEKYMNYSRVCAVFSGSPPGQPGGAGDVQTDSTGPG